jgi:CRP/FNR family cyclic AMP-dependent transcriptional regulator
MPLVSQHPFLRDAYPIDQKAMQRFLSFCERRQFPKKGIVFRAGDPADSLYYLVKGSVSVVVKDDDDNEVVLAYLNSGDYIGEMGLFYKCGIRTATIRARTECELAVIQYDRLRALFDNELKDEQATILTTVGIQLSERLVKASNRVSRLTSMDVSGRIAQTLLDMCHEPQAMSHPQGTQIHMSRQEIARIVGCSRETVGRILKQMADEGMIEVKGMDIVVFHSR